MSERTSAAGAKRRRAASKHSEGVRPRPATATTPRSAALRSKRDDQLRALSVAVDKLRGRSEELLAGADRLLARLS